MSEVKWPFAGRAAAAVKRRLGLLFPDLSLLVLVTLLFGLYGGTPYFHPDKIVDEALRALQNGGNPKYFHYPALGIYAQALVYWVVGMTDLTPRPSEGPGHVLTVLFSFLGVLSAYMTVRRITAQRGLSLLAGLFVATSLTWVRNSHYVTVDVPLAAMCMATAWLAVVLFSRPEPPSSRNLIGLGVMIGLTTATKYNGALVALVAAAPLGWLEWKRPRCLIRKLGVCAGAAFVAFFLFNPFILLDFPLFYEHFTSRVTEIQSGRPGFTMMNGWLFHLVHTLGEGYGIVPLVLALIGMIWLAVHRHVLPTVKLAVLVFPLLFFVVMGSSKAAFIRHAVPLIPFVAVFSALGVGALIHLLHPMQIPRALRIFAVALLFMAPLPNAWLSIRHNAEMARGDTRQILREVLRAADIPWSENAYYSGRYTKRTAERSGIKPETFMTSTFSIFPEYDHLYALHETRPEVMVFDSFSHDRLLERPPEDRPLLTLSDRYLLVLTPFTVPKDQVPLSPDSIYSPSMPDLVFRTMAGPYIEIFTVTRALAEQFQKAMRAYGVRAEIKPARESYFLQHVNAE